MHYYKQFSYEELYDIDARTHWKLTRERLPPWACCVALVGITVEVRWGNHILIGDYIWAPEPQLGPDDFRGKHFFDPAPEDHPSN